MPPSLFNNPAIFTQFSFAHRINPKEWNRIGAFYYFQGQFHIFKGNFTKFQDNFRTNGTILKFQEFSRTKVKFKDFSRSVRTLSSWTFFGDLFSQIAKLDYAKTMYCMSI